MRVVIDTNVLRDDIADFTTRRLLPGPGVSQIDPFLIAPRIG